MVGIVGVAVGMADVGIGCCAVVAQIARIVHGAWALDTDCSVL